MHTVRIALAAIVTSLALASPAAAADHTLKTKHDTAKNSIGNIR